MSPRFVILESATNKELWSSDDDDAFEEGSRIFGAVEAGEAQGYEKEIGTTWKGDLVLYQEIKRTY